MGKQLNLLMFKFEEVGDKIEGEVLEIQKDFEIPGSENEGRCDRYIMIDNEGTKRSFILGSATDKTLDGVDMVGMKIRVVYQGKKTISGGRSVNQFKVEDIEDEL